MNKIPKRFIRIWLGNAAIPEISEKWWQGFKDMHPDWDFVTINDDNNLPIPENIKDIYENVKTYAGKSDILRIIALYELGGIYIDTDMMPLKPFDELVESDNRPFIGQRSSVSFATGVIGSPQKHPALKYLLDFLPIWYPKHKDRSCSVSTGPAFVSAGWFNKKGINHLPIKTFYPYNGFMSPKYDEKMKLFSDVKNFPPEMLSAHFGNHKWGGKPKK